MIMFKIIFILLVCFPSLILAEYAIKDTNVEMSAEELAVAVEHWGEDIRQEAIVDKDKRRFYIGQVLANKKMADKAKHVSSVENTDFYWKRVFGIRGLLVKLYIKHYKEQLEIPDMSALAEEKYLAHKAEYAMIPETRSSSQILIKCSPHNCKRSEKLPIVKQLLEKLKNGFDFEEAVKNYSEDIGSKSRKGSLGQWIKKGQVHVVGEYVEGLFSIPKVGGYSDIIESKYGYHIIRLDGIKEKSFDSFEKVKPRIVAALKAQYEKLALAEFYKSFELTDKAQLNDKALDAIFSKYVKKNDKKN